MPVSNTGRRSEPLTAPEAKAKELGGVVASADSFHVIHFPTQDSAQTFFDWLERRYYQARTIVQPNEQCKFFSVSYR